MVSALSSNTLVGLDIETTGLSALDSRMLLVQISVGDQVFVMVPSRVEMQKILPFLRDPKWEIIIQNARFEQTFFKHVYDTEITNVFDTYLAELLIDSSSHSNGLGVLSEKYTGIKLNKDIRKTFLGVKPITTFTDEQLEYAALDAEVLLPIRSAQKEKIKSLGLERVADIEFALTNVVASLELEGVPIDVGKWKVKLANAEKERLNSKGKMNSLIFDGTGISEQMGMFERDGINLKSPKQVKEKFLQLGIDIDKTNERELARIDHPAAQELLRYRGLQKIQDAYGETFLGAIHPFTQRIHADFQQIGTETGRFSCRKPNLQQMPAEFRECVSLKDHKIVVADFANIELRILAEISKDKAFTAAFSSGADPHKSTAAIMFNIPLDKVDKDQRFIAKTINFGIMYGMGANKLMDMLNQKRKEQKQKNLTITQVRSIYTKYKEAYKGAVAWLRNAGEQGYAQGYATTMLGRRRILHRPDSNQPYDEFERQVGGVKRQAANSPIQGTNADITKLAMLNLHHDLSKFNYQSKMIIQVHDEIVVLAHEKEAESIKLLVEESMLSSAQEVLANVPVLVEAHIADVWRKD